MIVVDASVWVTIMIASDTFHSPSREWVRRHETTGDGFAVPTIVLPEVAGSVARQTRDIATISTLTIAVIGEPLAELAARLAADHGLKGADAIYVALADRLACPLVTWDAEMIRKTSGVIDARQPFT